MFVEWLAAICVFWLMAPVYLGGASIRFEGGGALRQLLGLGASFALFLAIWRVLYGVVVGMAHWFVALVITLLIGVAAFVWICKLGFRVAGIRLVPEEHGSHGHEEHGHQGEAEATA